MKLRAKYVSTTFLLFCAIVGSATLILAQPNPQRGPQGEPLGFLKRAISEAGAPALSSDQETQLMSLITTFRNAQPSGPDEQLQAAHAAFNSAILGGDLAAAKAQATSIANRSAELSNTRLQAAAQLQIDALAVLKSGGQLDPLKEKFGDRLAGVVGSLAGGPPFGGGRPGIEPGARPARPGGSGRS